MWIQAATTWGRFAPTTTLPCPTHEREAARAESTRQRAALVHIHDQHVRAFTEFVRDVPHRNLAAHDPA